MNIVFIDDQEDLRDILTLLLEDSMGATVAAFSNTSEAHDYIESNKDKISIIISDFNLEGETGLCLYPKVVHHEIPFFLLSGMELDNDHHPQMQSFVSNNKNKIIQKPVDEDILVDAIKSIL